MSERRFSHSMSVSRIAGELAAIHHENIENAKVAGLLHDLAREWDYDSMFSFLHERNIEITNDEKNIPILLHGLVASILAVQKLNINDSDIINSIKNHTMGRKNMSNLEKIIYISDYLASAENSDRYQPMMDLAQKSLNSAVLSAYQSSYDYLTSQNLPIANNFYQNWEYYKQL